jgi:hypothetical protein
MGAYLLHSNPTARPRILAVSHTSPNIDTRLILKKHVRVFDAAFLKLIDR